MSLVPFCIMRQRFSVDEIRVFIKFSKVCCLVFILLVITFHLSVNVVGGDGADRCYYVQI